MYRLTTARILFILLTIPCFLPSAISSSEDHFPKEAMYDNLIGYEYNLWGVKAQNKAGNATYEYTGRIFLDKRKEYRATFKEDEHFYFFKEKFSNGQVFKIPGSQKNTQFINKESTQDYYIALKFGPQWKHHQLRDILENMDGSVGTDVGCKECNYKKNFYDLKNDWSLTVYYQIKPIFKDTDQSDSEMAAAMLKALDVKEGFLKSQGFEEPEPVIAAEVKTQTPITSKPTVPLPTASKPTVSNTAPVVTSPSVETAEVPQIIIQEQDTYHVLFRVLNDPNQTFDDLSYLGQVYKETFDSRGSTRYLIGNSTSFEEAKILEQKVRAAGYKSTILASYKNGQLKDYIDSAVTTSHTHKKTYTNTYAQQQEEASKSYGRSIQFTAIGDGAKSFSQLSHLGKVYAEKVDGKKLYRYKLKMYDSLDEASTVDEVKGLGFTGAFLLK